MAVAIHSNIHKVEGHTHRHLVTVGLEADALPLPPLPASPLFLYATYDVTQTNHKCFGEKLEAVKRFQTDQRRLEVTESLASNPDLVISSSSNDEVNAMMMCDAVLANNKSEQPINRSQVHANLGKKWSPSAGASGGV